MSKEGSYSRPIGSYFTPVKKPEDPAVKGPKVTISNSLKSSKLPTTPSFSPKNYQKSTGPFQLVNNNNNSSRSSSTENLTEHLAQFKLNTAPLRDLNTPTKKVINLGSDDDEEEEEDMDLEEESDSEESIGVTRRVLRKRKPAAPIVIHVSDEEVSGEEEEDDEEQPVFKRLKRRKVISYSDEDDDGDEAYEDENEKLNREFDNEDEQVSIERIQNICPERSVEEIRRAIRQMGSAVRAIAFFMKSQSADGDELESKSRDRLKAKDRERLVLNMFNDATSQDIQDMTGCKEKIADLIVNDLRPFSDLEDLEDKLKTTKGASIKYIAACREMVAGYDVVDNLIVQIEKKGSKLRNILNIWQGWESSKANTPTVGSDNENDDQPDEKAGTHLMHLDVNPKVDKNSDIYKDALDGYLNEQPNYVNKEFSLKDYQILGVNWMLLLYRKQISGILADEMGLGKTAQVISLLGRLYEMGEQGPHLVIVPSSTLENWMREFKRFCPKLTIRLYHGSIKERAEQRYELAEDIDEFQVILTTYNVATSNRDDRGFLKSLGCQSMILDEGHMIKNCTSQRYNELMKLKIGFRLLLTGTPLQNNLQELVSLLIFIMPNMFSENEEQLRSIFKIRTTATDEDKDRKGRETAIQVLSSQRIQRAKQMMTPFVLRRKKQDVLKDLPQKEQVIEMCTMTPNQRQLYHDIILKSKKSFEAKKEEEDKAAVEKKQKTAMNAQFESMSNIVIHLRKAADHPLLFRKVYTDELCRQMAKEIMREVKYWDANEDYIYEDMCVMSDFELNNLCKVNKKISHHQLKNEEWMDSGKVEKLKVILPECKAKKEKVLIFSQFTRVLDILEMVMSTLKVTYVRLDGETKVMERQKVIDDFNEDESIDVFLLSTKAGGFGINLTSANVVVLYDLDFNPQNDRQAEDRAHRVGQTKDVKIIKLISQDSIEEYILKMADIKLNLDKRVSSSGDIIEEEVEDEQQQKQSLQSMIREAFIKAEKIYK